LAVVKKNLPLAQGKMGLLLRGLLVAAGLACLLCGGSAAAGKQAGGLKRWLKLRNGGEGADGSDSHLLEFEAVEASSCEVMTGKAACAQCCVCYLLLN
jgi:hypothetical protein